jgi:two-component system, OmpR family, response regulator RegX3
MTLMTTDPNSGHADPYQPVAPHTAGRLRLLTVGPMVANLDGKQLRVNGAVVPLPLKEFDLLVTLMDNAGRVMTRRELLDQVWQPGYATDNKTLDVHVKRLRGRLRTVRGLGYVIDL